ncbi:hypothetical protein ENU1_065700 [Entamoeba nuttalli P19]|uniref:Uncharacterized protein n=1 Tax=Entamoeba nuttalli (strain P19) TaxID=1076696 RepID=K2HXZ0_ENTNP|nr:hypothetical protein ENU1_065700 [Entamoeba nuttalli P19]EKE41165.1 hypothetical protein ENU1_065700 [Entamoeba nuttalli P19]|eukprot:XP_008856499.1 hypothetical protein ENU1_065700 [Entamoeba nuttalli P19]
MNETERYESTAVQGIVSYLNAFIQTKTNLGISIEKTLKGLQEGLKSTIILITYMQSFQNFIPPHTNPINLFQMNENAEKLIRMAKSFGLEVTCSASAITQPQAATASQVLGLLWQLIDYDLRKTLGSMDCEGDVMKWVNTTLGSKRMTNYTSDLQDGIIFRDLLRTLGIPCGNSLEDVITASGTIGCQLISVESVQNCVVKMNFAFLAALMKWKKEQDEIERKRREEQDKINKVEAEKRAKEEEERKKQQELEQQQKKIKEAKEKEDKEYNSLLEEKERQKIVDEQQMKQLEEKHAEEERKMLEKLKQAQEESAGITAVEHLNNTQLVEEKEKLNDESERIRQDIDEAYKRKQTTRFEMLRLQSDNIRNEKEFQKEFKEADRKKQEMIKKEKRMEERIQNLHYEELSEKYTSKVDENYKLSGEVHDMEQKKAELTDLLQQKERQTKRVNSLIDDVSQEILNVEKSILQENKRIKDNKREQARIQKQISDIQTQTKIVKMDTHSIIQEREHNEKQLDTKLDKIDDANYELGKLEMANADAELEQQAASEELDQFVERSKILLQQMESKITRDLSREKKAEERSKRNLNKDRKKAREKSKQLRKEKDAIEIEVDSKKHEKRMQESKLDRISEQYLDIRQQQNDEEIKLKSKDIDIDNKLKEINSRRKKLGEAKGKSKVALQTKEGIGNKPIEVLSQRDKEICDDIHKKYEEERRRKREDIAKFVESVEKEPTPPLTEKTVLPKLVNQEEIERELADNHLQHVKRFDPVLELRKQEVEKVKKRENMKKQEELDRKKKIVELSEAKVEIEKKLKEEELRIVEEFKQKREKWRKERKEIYKRIYDIVDITDYIKEEPVELKGVIENNASENASLLVKWDNVKEVSEMFKKWAIQRNAFIDKFDSTRKDGFSRQVKCTTSPILDEKVDLLSLRKLSDQSSEKSIYGKSKQRQKVMELAMKKEMEESNKDRLHTPRFEMAQGNSPLFDENGHLNPKEKRRRVKENG